MINDIVIKGAAQHNLKNIDVTIPRNKLVVITGLSGSGKSSLAFDTLYAEGQRRYVESLSAYARMFLDRMQKPKVRLLNSAPPALLHVPPSLPLPKFMTICDCCTPTQAPHTAPNADANSLHSPPRKYVSRSPLSRKAED